MIQDGRPRKPPPASLLPPGAVAVSTVPAAWLRRLSEALRQLRHDLANPLTAASSFIELARRQSPPADATLLERSQDQILTVRERLRLATSQLLPDADTSPARITMLRTRLANRARDLGLDISWALDDELNRVLPPGPLALVLRPLVDNAIDAIAAAGVDPDGPVAGRTIVVQSSSVTVGQDRWHVLSVRDRGPGCDSLAEAACGARTRQGNAHLGFGLTIAATQVAASAGTLYITSWPDAGFEAIAVLPLADDVAAESPSEGSTAAT